MTLITVPSPTIDGWMEIRRLSTRFLTRSSWPLINIRLSTSGERRLSEEGSVRYICIVIWYFPTDFWGSHSWISGSKTKYCINSVNTVWFYSVIGSRFRSIVWNKIIIALQIVALHVSKIDCCWHWALTFLVTVQWPQICLCLQYSHIAFSETRKKSMMLWLIIKPSKQNATSMHEIAVDILAGRRHNRCLTLGCLHLQAWNFAACTETGSCFNLIHTHKLRNSWVMLYTLAK